MGQKEIIDILRQEKPYLQKEFGLITVGLFGSFAKETEQSGSDIDLLVELSDPKFDYLAGLQIYLERRLGKPVDVIRKRKGMSEHFLNRIEKDMHYV